MPTLLLRSAFLLALLTPAACTVGDITGGGGGGDDIGGGGDDDTGGAGPDAAPAPDFSASLSPTSLATTLGTTSRYTVTLDSYNFTGPVTLTATGVPTGWTATFEPATMSMPLDDQLTAELVIVVPSDALAATATIGIDATAAPGTRSVSGSLAVANEYILAIGAGTGTGTHGFPGTLRLPLGATLHIKNSDGITHRIHSDGGAGFPHQDNDMANGQEYVVTPGDVGGYTFYCHAHGVGTGVTNLVVQ